MLILKSKSIAEDVLIMIREYVHVGLGGNTDESAVCGVFRGYYSILRYINSNKDVR